MSTSTPEPLGVTIVRQIKQKESDGRGGFHYVWHITYKTQDGVESTLEIPASEYTMENVAAAIVNEKQHIDAVHQLQ